MAVTANDVSELLNSDLDDAHLILEEGRLKVVSRDAADDFRAGLTVASAAELRADIDLGESPSEDTLATIAATLEQRVAELGA